MKRRSLTQRSIKRLAPSLLMVLALIMESSVWAGQPIRKTTITIDSQPLALALSVFSEQTGLQVGYEAKLAENVVSQAVHNIEGPATALEKLLEGTVLEYQFINDDTVIIRASTKPVNQRQESEKPHTSLDDMFKQTTETLDIEEVIVTSQKQGQNPQDIPIALKVITKAHAESHEYTNISDIALHTPGLNWAGSATKPQIFLRGVGSSDFQSGSHNPVSLYADGALLGSTFGTSSLLLDIDRVEVLKGPQGTLWGRNTTGGLIHYISKKAVPGQRFEGTTTLGMAFAGETQISAAVGVPISERIALRVAGRRLNQGAPFHNSNPEFQEKIGGGVWSAMRANLVAHINDRLTLDATTYFGNLDIDNSAPQKNLGLFGTCETPGTLGTRCEDAGGFVNTPEAREIFNGFETFERADRSGTSLSATFKGDDITLTSITAFNAVSRISLNDNDGSPSVLSEGNFQDDYEGFSQELRLASSGLDTQWRWVTGLYYYQDDLTWYRSSVRDTTLSGARFHHTSTETVAWFGEITHQPRDRWELTAGIRFTYDRRTANEIRTFLYSSSFGEFNSQQDAFDNLTSSLIVIDDLDVSWTEPSGRLSALYRLSDTTNLWATASRGFKGGDPNSGAFLQGEFNISDPEFVTSVEAGIKMARADGRIQVNASAYLYDYSDKQVFTQQPGNGVLGNVTTLSNAAELTINGLDLELNWMPQDELRFSLGLAYTEAEFDQFLNPGSGEDLQGNVTAITPKLSLNFIVSYKWPLSNGAAVSIESDAVFTDDIYFTNGNDPLVFQGAYWLIGGNITYHSANDKWRFRAWGKNLSDEYYWVGGFNLSQRGAILLSPSRPRTLGATLTYNF